MKRVFIIIVLKISGCIIFDCPDQNFDDCTIYEEIHRDTIAREIAFDSLELSIQLEKWKGSGIELHVDTLPFPNEMISICDCICHDEPFVIHVRQCCSGGFVIKN